MANVKDYRRIVMTGDLVSVERVTREREVLTTDFVKELVAQQDLDTGVLPTGCVRKITKMANKTASGYKESLFIMQQPAHIAAIQFRKKPETSEEEQDIDKCILNLKLSWPNTLWLVLFRQSMLETMSLVATASPLMLAGDETPIYYLPMPNQFDDGRFCFGNIVLDQAAKEEVRVEQLLQYLGTSLWNMDLYPDFEGRPRWGVKSLTDWHDKTAADPQFYKKLTLDFHHLGKTVGGVIAKIMRSKNE